MAAAMMDQSMMDNVTSLAEWKAQKRAQRQRLIMVWYPAELIGYEDGVANLINRLHKRCPSQTNW